MLMEINGEMYDLIDDSKMPSAEESKRFTFPEEIEKKSMKTVSE